ncbi:hypothetical protein C8R47DRAFT_1227921 [Mycena vitilis]|nr:hypothetical protein C8R47DRAFT_1227921 [Mycena vitilis]
MNSSYTLPLSLPVQEMWDYIIDHLQHSKQDLRSCSLACRTFVPRTQSHLFRSISIFQKGSRDAESLARELGSIIAGSPHLLAHMRRLDLGDCKQAVVAHLCQLPWSRLEDLSLMYRKFSGLIDDTDLGQLYYLVSVPSLRQLTLRGDWAVEAIHEIVTRTQWLERLRFIDCYPDTSPSHPPASAVPKARSKIRHLISMDSEIFDVLADPSFPLDFPALTHLRCSGSLASHALAVFAFRHRFAIESLDVGTADAGIESLNLGLFPVLKDLACTYLCVELNQLLNSLLPNNIVETIRTGLSGREYVRELGDFQATIRALKMPMLRRIEFNILLGPSISPESKVSLDAQFASFVNRELCDLVEKGLLFLYIT